MTRYKMFWVGLLFIAVAVFLAGYAMVGCAPRRACEPWMHCTQEGDTVTCCSTLHLPKWKTCTAIGNKVHIMWSEHDNEN